jgi:hypothetical protein
VCENQERIVEQGSRNRLSGDPKYPREVVVDHVRK